MCLDVERSLLGDLLVAMMIELRTLKHLECVQDLLLEYIRKIAQKVSLQTRGYFLEPGCE